LVGVFIKMETGNEEIKKASEKDLDKEYILK
jgi:hypothetical protein